MREFIYEETVSRHRSNEKMKWLEKNAKFNDDTMWFELKKDATEEEKNIFDEYTLFFKNKRN